ncbi:MAG: addiction module antidote protein, HigA family [Spirochaetes bacterium]|nr:MAG: addiction module antidote protein, HigA family [Spirochaetota bacterium]
MVNRMINEYNPETVTHPGETLNDVLEEKGMSQAELSERTGRPKKTINEIIKGKTSITAETAIQFERVLGIPASFWNNRQRRFDEFVAQKAEGDKLLKHRQWIKTLPIKEMISNNWLPAIKQEKALLNEVFKFFGINSPDEWTSVWDKPSIVYRQSKAFTKNPIATSVWLRAGEIEAQKIQCKPFDRTRFKIILNQIKPYTREVPDLFAEKMIEMCAATGIALVFVPPLKGVPVYGVTRWLNPERALIQLSLRGKYEDIFWFTFFHEAGHILLHGKRDVFIESNIENNSKENEADSFARDILIPQEEWEKFIQANIFSAEKIKTFAKEMNISPAIVVGRLQHERKIAFAQLNGLRRKYELSSNDQ